MNTIDDYMEDSDFISSLSDEIIKNESDLNYTWDSDSSYLGFHTFSVLRTELSYLASNLIKDAKMFRDKTNEIDIITDKKHPDVYWIVYNDRRGIYWRIWSSHTWGTFDISCIEATINPKVFAGIKDFVSAATLDDLKTIEERFNYESNRLSEIIGDFSKFNLNRGDYCVNFDLERLNHPCSVKQQMILFNRGDIPIHYERYKEYDKKVSHRFISPKESFYLKSKSVNLNTYGRYAHLFNNDPNNPCLEASKNIIRFEVQCKSRKLYPMKRLLKEKTDSSIELINEMFSDEYCRDIVDGYYKRVIMRGDYYTLKRARRLIQDHGFRLSKETRLLFALELVNECRSIAVAKSTLEGKALDEFRQSLRELTSEGINPVTIPREWSIPHIPNLLNSYYEMIDETENRKHREQFESECMKEVIKRKV